jgi:hypothetical protein
MEMSSEAFSIARSLASTATIVGLFIGAAKLGVFGLKRIVIFNDDTDLEITYGWLYDRRDFSALPKISPGNTVEHKLVSSTQYFQLSSATPTLDERVQNIRGVIAKIDYFLTLAELKACLRLYRMPHV